MQLRFFVIKWVYLSILLYILIKTQQAQHARTTFKCNKLKKKKKIYIYKLLG